jgi:molecular chaperone DnaJ
MMIDLYELLGVRSEATEAEIRRAYQKRARVLHPHLNPGDPASAERFEAVSRAFAVLSDPGRRAAYDRGDEPPTKAAATASGSFEGFDFSAEVKVERLGFQEIFEGVLRTAARTADKVGEQGEDLEQSTRLAFEESLSGARRRLQLVRYEPCPACQGLGEVAIDPVPCPRCAGAGQVRGRRGHMIFSRRCHACDGAGSLRRRACARCAAEGRLLGSEWLDVQIPPGAGDGTRVRVPGCGNVGRRGGSPGDFVLALEVEPHAVFRREGDDLHCQVSVSLVDAALGGHVEVPTPEGPMAIELPAGTQNNQRFRLRKRGMPHLGAAGRGDLWVEVRVMVPTVTDDEGRALLLEFARRKAGTPAGPAEER